MAVELAGADEVPPAVTEVSGSVAAHIREVDGRIARVLQSARASEAAWEIPDRLAQGRTTPHWFELPIWLDRAWGGEPDRRPAPELSQVLWGQYALFLFIRIQDDLLDRQRNDLPSLLVADRFLVESLESFRALELLDRSFWHSYNGWLRDTVEGIFEVAHLESTAGKFTVDHLPLHARVCSIFKVGTLALCRLRGREQDWPWLEALLDQLAIFSQIGDDLHDLTEDVESGRYTWPANVLFLVDHSGLGVSQPGELILRLGRNHVIVEQLRAIAEAAIRFVPATAPEPVRQLPAALYTRVNELERDLHESMVRYVFGDLMAAGRT